MSAIPYDTQTQNWDTSDQERPTTPGRPRRRWLNRKTAALAAVITCAAGFYGGVRVEKSQLSSTATAAPAGTARAGVAGATGAAAGARAGFLGGAGGGGNASFGTVSSVNGNTIYLTESSGNAVKVTLSSATKITKSQSVSKTSVRPGDTVVIQGATSSNGTIAATSVSDSGASASGRGASGTGAATTGSGSSSTNTGTAG
jgi:Domain of unknown function (DUF5666)